MRLGLVDRIYTRIGASDNVARGRSTFMVEMTETATILNTATPQSLILLDEMGRGTATFDGLSLAWATVEYLHARGRRPHALCHPLPRAHHAGRKAAAPAQPARRRERSRRAALSSCIPSSRARPTRATVSKSRASPACPWRSSNAPATFCASTSNPEATMCVETDRAAADDHVHAALAAHPGSPGADRH